MRAGKAGGSVRMMRARVKDINQQQTPVTRALYQFIRETITQLIANALEEELQEFLLSHDEIRLHDGAKAVVRNGYLPTRTILTSAGEIAVKVPRTRDRSDAGTCFSSSLFPRYHSCARLNDLLPETFLRSFLDRDARNLLRVVLGVQVDQIPSGILHRVQNLWFTQCLEWHQRPLAASAHLFWWAGSLQSAIEKTELLFIVGMNHDGRHELVTVAEASSDAGEAKPVWIELLRQLRHRGLHNSPKLLEAGRRPDDIWQAAKLYYPETLIIGHDVQSTDQQGANVSVPGLRFV